MYWPTFRLLCSTLATTDTTIVTNIPWLVDDIYQVSLVGPGIIPNSCQIWKKNPDHHQVPSEFLFPEFLRISLFWKESVKEKNLLMKLHSLPPPKKIKTLFRFYKLLKWYFDYAEVPQRSNLALFVFFCDVLALTMISSSQGCFCPSNLQEKSQISHCIFDTDKSLKIY